MPETGSRMTELPTIQFCDGASFRDPLQTARIWRAFLRLLLLEWSQDGSLHGILRPIPHPVSGCRKSFPKSELADSRDALVTALRRVRNQGFVGTATGPGSAFCSLVRAKARQDTGLWPFDIVRFRRDPKPASVPASRREEWSSG